MVVNNVTNVTKGRNNLALTILTLAAPLILVSSAMQAQTDPGVRGGAAGAGSAFSNLTTKESSFFSIGSDQFQEVQSVTGSVQGTEAGLGPRFNLDSCAGCHAHPAIGGSSPLVNPQVAVATKNGAANSVHESRRPKIPQVQRNDRRHQRWKSRRGEGGVDGYSPSVGLHCQSAAVGH